MSTQPADPLATLTPGSDQSEIGERSSRVFAALRVRAFRLFLAGALLSQAGSWMTRVAQTLLILDLTDGSGLAVGLLALCQYGPLLLLGPWSGAVLDRADKRALLMTVQVVAGAVSASAGLVILLTRPTLGVLYTFAVAQGLATLFTNPGGRAFVTELVSPRHLVNALSLTTAGLTSSRVFGPAVAGVVIVGLGHPWCFLIDGATYVVATVLLWLVRPGEIASSGRQPKSRGQIRQGFADVAAEPALRVPVVMLAWTGMFAFNLQLTVPLLIRGPLGGSDLSYTIVFSVLSCGSVLGALYAARTGQVTRRALVWSCGAFGAGLAALAATPRLAVAVPVALFVGATSIAFSTLASTGMQSVALAEMRGRVLSTQAMVNLGGAPLGGLLLGLAADRAGARAALEIGAAACALSALYAAARLPHGGLRRRRAEVLS